MYVDIDQLKKEFSKRLRIELRRKNMTQTELADLVDMSRAQINHYIKGKRLPSYYNLSKIVAALGCSMDKFNCL